MCCRQTVTRTNLCMFSLTASMSLLLITACEIMSSSFISSHIASYHLPLLLVVKDVSNSTSKPAACKTSSPPLSEKAETQSWEEVCRQSDENGQLEETVIDPNEFPTPGSTMVINHSAGSSSGSEENKENDDSQRTPQYKKKRMFNFLGNPVCQIWYHQLVYHF